MTVSDRPIFTLRLQPLPHNEELFLAEGKPVPPVECRLRTVLKFLLRASGFRCLSIVEDQPSPTAEPVIGPTVVYVLRRRDNLKPPGECDGFIIAATTELRAREIAAGKAGWEGQQMWTDPKLSTCHVFDQNADETVLFRSFSGEKTDA